MKTLVGYCCHALNLSWTRLSGLLPGVQRYVLYIFCIFLPANCKSRFIVANLMTLHWWASVCLVKLPISYEKNTITGISLVNAFNLKKSVHHYNQITINLYQLGNSRVLNPFNVSMKTLHNILFILLMDSSCILRSFPPMQPETFLWV